MRRFSPALLPIAALGLAALVALVAPAQPARAQDAGAAIATITVNGQGRIEVAPDMATMRLAVRADAPTTAEAMDEASRATAGILAMLDAEGVAEEDIQTGAIRLNPVYGSTLLSGQRQITGYTAFNSITVTVNDLDALGGLLTAAVNEGANTLSGVDFGLKDPEVHEDEARRLAVADARRRATLYAEAAEVDLAGLISLNEAGTSGYRPVVAEPVVLEASLSWAQHEVPVAAGKIELAASVVVIYGIAAPE